MKYEIRLARQTGGKAGKGRNQTSTVQVFCDGLLVKQFRFRVDNMAGYGRAKEKAEAYVKSQPFERSPNHA